MPQTTQQPSSQLIQGLRLSSVVPAKITGDNRAHKLTGMDLALKLHYLRGVYFFRDVQVGIDGLKEPMFRCLELYYPVAGRIRRADGGESGDGGGRPFVKCNDSGVRIVEARSEKTINEWLEMEDHAEIDDKVLIYDHVLGHDLGFTPLVFVQFTRFKCGGISVGLSWAHVLGDAFSASSFISMWGHIMAGHVPPKSLHVPSPGKPAGSPGKGHGKASSLRQVEPVGDRWITTSDRKMRTNSLHITGDQLDLLVTSHGKACSRFHLMAAVIWKSLSKIRGEGRLKRATICTSNCHDEIHRCLLENRMVVGTVEADVSVFDVDVSELATWMAEREAKENRDIEEIINRDGRMSDYILYGANLTFVNLEEADIYGLELMGQKPIYANYTINGVGDEGVILILPWRGTGKQKERDGRKVTMILPEDEVSKLKKELIMDWKFF
ncbi:hypothetical protein CDL15_Pgr019210 [Punica granatum]|nr:hypothetical protein CDL15_Pgr019210 [Punica granatum]PKI73513.1 hypothetical protein CRG98_006094 [Punica granatum]